MFDRLALLFIGLQAFSEDFEDVSTSQQGCHVVQKILQRVVFLNTGFFIMFTYCVSGSKNMCIK